MDLLETQFAPALLDHVWGRPTEAGEAWADLPWDPAVAGAMDTACWDLWSRRRHTPLAHALGGQRTALTAGVTLPQQKTVESVVREVNRQVGAGFRRIRLEISPGWDLDVVHAVQASFPFLVLQVDAGGRYTESPEHLEALHALDKLGLLAIEDPFASDDLEAHARLTSELRTPVALYRSLTCLEDVDEVIRAEAGNAVNVDSARLGGLTPARRRGPGGGRGPAGLVRFLGGHGCGACGDGGFGIVVGCHTAGGDAGRGAPRPRRGLTAGARARRCGAGAVDRERSGPWRRPAGARRTHREVGGPGAAARLSRSHPQITEHC